MRTILRLIAVLTLLSVLATVAFVLGIWQRGGILPVLHAGIFGVLTVIGWLITLFVGPPAVVLLWRQNNLGRIASILFWGSICLYYVVGLLFFRTPDTHYGSLFSGIIVSMIPIAVLVSPKAQLACKSRNNAIR